MDQFNLVLKSSKVFNTTISCSLLLLFSKYDQVFECNRWLAVDEDDGLIIRDLFAHGTQFFDTVSYDVKVKTGDIRNA